MFCIDGRCYDSSYEDNKDFAEVITKLSVFDEMEKNVEGSIDSLSIFKGYKSSCTKNILSNVLYDCCGTMDGLALSLNLARCTTEEKNLAKKKNQGLCHYVGRYDKDTLWWKSSDVNTYCCFPSKLVYVVQKEARKQLKIGWGSAKDPSCRGLIPDEIKRLDFSKMDLKEAYEELLGSKDKLKYKIPDKENTQKFFNDQETQVRIKEKMDHFKVEHFKQKSQ